MQRVVFHIPHDGKECPPELMKSVCVTKEKFRFYQEKMQDSDVSKFVPDGYESACFKISRLLCDVERFANDSERMEKYGMGFCYENAYDGTKIKNVTDKLKEDTMKYYSEHHRRLDDLALQKNLFLIDLHSFSDDIVVYCDEKPPFSDICLGYEENYCNPLFVWRVADLFCKAGYSVSQNIPYAGSLVPNAAMHESNVNCFSIMIEINKRVYRPYGITKQPEIAKIKAILNQIAHEAERENGRRLCK